MTTRSGDPAIFLFCALPCEAKPLVAHFRLKKNLASQIFAQYSNGEVSLTVTGVGKTAMAAGVGYTMALSTTRTHPILVNVGVAGHRQHDLGEIFTAEKITDADSGRNHYPPLVARQPGATATITTVSSPHLEYREDCLYDMEASAFYESASRFTTGELIQCLKVISDNAASPAANIRAKQVSKLLAGSSAALQALLGEMTPLDEIQLPRDLHITSSQRNILHKQLSRYQVLSNGDLPDFSNIHWRTSKELLQWLAVEIENIPVVL